MNFNERSKMFTNDISTKEWVGQIVSIDDPMKMLRVKAKVFGLFDGEDMSEDLLPWLFHQNNSSFSSTESGGCGNFDVPKVGTIIKVTFPTGDIYSGQYESIMDINESVRNEILSEEYEGVHVMRVDDDEEFRVYYTPLQGIVMKLKDFTLNVTKDQSLHVTTKDGNRIELNSRDDMGDDKLALKVFCTNNIEVHSAGNAMIDVEGTCTLNSGKLELGRDGANERVVLGSSFKKIFDNHIHVGFLGIPTLSAKDSGFACPLSDDVYTTKKGGN